MAIAGVINLYKPRWETSAYHAYRLRPIVGERKIGHSGALDPFADGVMVVCIGKATRLVERLMGLPKCYVAGLRLGVTNETFDTERPMDEVPGAADPGRAAIEAALAGMVGDVMQVPPHFSAVHSGGKRAYDQARRGEMPALPPRPVRIDRIAICRYAWPVLDLEIRCGRGTYIRAIARDLGAALGVGAVCESLTRTEVGPFRLSEAVDIRVAPADAVRAAVRSVEEVEAALSSESAG